jgi:ribosomal protein S18 acetylase RimI-like enzyme
LAAPELGCVALAHSDGAPLGYGVLTTKYSMEFGGLSASVEDLYVCAPSRGRGAGSALLAFLREDASRRGCVAMQVEVAADNAVALALYRAYGLVETGDNRLVLSGPLPVKP